MLHLFFRILSAVLTTCSQMFRRSGAGRNILLRRRMGHVELLESRALLTANLVLDINPLSPPTQQQSSFSAIADVNGIAYFTSASTAVGEELWSSDGTATGTAIVKDIFVGSNSSKPKELTNVSGTLYFVAGDGVHGDELWKSDGTVAGTVLVKDIRSGTTGSAPFYLTNINGTLYFSADNGVVGRELWKSDGTELGTVLVKDILSGNTGSSPGKLAMVNSEIYFAASDGVSGRELWKSDGTSAGTVMVADITNGVQGSSPIYLTNVSGTLFFNAVDNQLWKSDGTAAGTEFLANTYYGYFGAYLRSLTNVNGTLYFSAPGSEGFTDLWRSDGTRAGTVTVDGANGLYPRSLTNVNGLLYFNGRSEVWKSDGTPSGTSMVADISTGRYGSVPTSLTNVNGTLYFKVADYYSTSYYDPTCGYCGEYRSYEENGFQLWKTDGTSAGTELVKDLSGSSAKVHAFLPTNFSNINGSIFFRSNDFENGQVLWKSDGTTVGTLPVKQLREGNAGSSPSSLTNVNDRLYFAANNGVNGSELWKSDGTALGTVLVADIRSGAIGSSPSFLTDVNGMLYFQADDGLSGSELWKSDGTAAGTVLVADIRSGANGSSPSSLVNLNGTLYFSADDGSGGSELWKSDGTAAGTVRVKDLIVGSRSSSPSFLANVNGLLYFTASHPTKGRELWKSDGTAVGTVLVKDIRIGSDGSNPGYLTNVNGIVYFRAKEDATGYELWKSDGTAAGTVLVKDIQIGTRGSSPTGLANVNGKLFFTANEGVNGNELWKSDGTASGTALVKNIHDESSGANPTSLTNVNGLLYFKANDGVKGGELWKSDGSEAGTTLAADVLVGPGGSNPANLTVIGKQLFFSAMTPTLGRELYVLPVTYVPTDISLSNASVDENTAPDSVIGNLSGTDPDVGDVLQFSLPAGIGDNDLFKIVGTSLLVNAPLDFETHSSLSITIRATDHDGLKLDKVFTIQVLNTNDAPVLDTSLSPSLPTMNEDVTNPTGGSIASLLSGASDADVLPLKGLALTQTSAITKGKWQYSLDAGATWIDVGTVSTTSALLLPSNGTQSRLRYLANANVNGTLLISYQAWDQTQGTIGAKVDTSLAGGATAYSIAIETATLQIIAVNDAPVLDTSLSPTFTAVNEDTTNPTGNTILSLMSGVTDVDLGALRGLALTQTTGSATGKWQYTLNGGATWTDVGIVSTSAALLLPSNGTQSKLRYVPNANFNGTVQIGYRAWDQTQGAVGTKVNFSSPALVGGTKAYSILIETATLQVTPVNDAPVLDTSLTPTLTAINEDTSNPSGYPIVTLLTGVTDADSGAQRGLALTQTTGTTTGKWQYTLNGGAAWIDIGTVSTTAALLIPSNGTQSKVRYIPNANFNGSVQIGYRAWDQTQGSVASKVDVSTTALVGGTKAFSPAIETASLTINPVNDAPVWLSSSPISLGTIRNTVANSPRYTISASLLNSNVSDVDVGASKGIAIIGIPPASAATVWYQLSGSTTWTQITSASASSALLLPSNAAIQFRPAAGFVGTAQLRFRAWDQTTGLIEGRAALSSLSSTGGSTAYSAAIGLADLTITA